MLAYSANLKNDRDVFYPLHPRLSGGGRVTKDNSGNACLELPIGTAGTYRLAQLDDYTRLRRKDFLWSAPLQMDVDACVSKPVIPGTWGFGFWNDPLSCASGIGGSAFRLPSLPNAIWFFFAANPNYLALDDNLPAFGNLAAVYRSAGWQPLLLAAAMLTIPSLFFSSASKMLRKVSRTFIHQVSTDIPLDPTQWHHYQIIWKKEMAIFCVDDQAVLKTEVTPVGRLGFVLWIDNQFLSTPPNARLTFGNLANPEPVELRFRELRIERNPP